MDLVLVAAFFVLLMWLGLAREGRRALAITAIGLATWGRRIGGALVVVAGIGGVVGVLVALQAMGQGLQKTLHSTGDTNTVIAFSGASSEANSMLTREQAALLAGLPGILVDSQGKAIVSPESVGGVRLAKKSSGVRSNVGLRGVGPQAARVRPTMRILEGRMFQPGTQELVVGTRAREIFEGLDVGRVVNINNQAWRIVGVFATGDAHESELFGDVETLAATYRRSGYQSITVRLISPQSFEQLAAAAARDPRLKLVMKTTADYYSGSAAKLIQGIRLMGNLIAAIMAVGALSGALTVMYTAVITRAREIGVLRAIGFDATPIVVSVMLEMMLLAACGGLLGAAVAWTLFSQFTGSTVGANFSVLVFQFDVAPEVLWNGMKWALAIGFIGGLLPALRAATMPTAAVLRAT